jgi:Rha family phage regulatory protein
MNDIQIVFTKDDRPLTDSRRVAEYFGKEHRHVTRDIESKIFSDCDNEFTTSNFGLSSYTDSTGKKNKMYVMTKDGFLLLAMGFTGKKAMQFKIAYIAAFNKMESFIRQLATAKAEFHDLTEAIRMSRDGKELHSWNFSNEFDLINRIVLGVSTKKFRAQHGITGDSIRPFLTPEQLEQVTKLQRFDSGLVVTTPDYQERKRILAEYRDRISRKTLTA